MTLAARTHIALVHHPVLDRTGRVVTTAVTNLDIHDLARSSRTFGLASYFVVTPIEAQRALVSQIIGHWTEGAGREHNEKRTDALELVRVVASLDDVLAALGNPLVVATTARTNEKTTSYSEIQGMDRDMLILFGTGWGLAPEVYPRVDAVLPPIRGAGEYNHLSVRSAVAIVLDRLFGNRDSERF
jgi:hypothetical protein